MEYEIMIFVMFQMHKISFINITSCKLLIDPNRICHANRNDVSSEK